MAKERDGDQLHPVPVLPAGSVPRRNAVKSAVFISLLGPPIGALIFIIPMVIVSILGQTTAMTISDIPTLFKELAGVVLLVVMFSYIFGFVPALASALMLCFIVGKGRDYSYADAAITATIAACLWGIVFDLLTGKQGGAFMTLLVPSLAAALVARYLIGRFGWLERAIS